MGRRDQRKREIAELRSAGREARFNDKPRSSVPWKPFESTNADHWLRGWDEQDMFMRAQAENYKNSRVELAISDVQDEATQRALEAMWEYIQENCRG